MKQNFMKWNMILWSLCGILFLAGCGTARGESSLSAVSPDTVDYNDYIRSADIAYTDVAYLFKSGAQIYYLDAALSAPLSVMCAQAKCSHRESGCTSYIGSTMPIYAWNNKIYYVEHGAGPVVYRMDIDGTNRELVREFKELFSDGNYSCSTGEGAGYLLIDGFFQGAIGEQPFLYLAPLEDSSEEPIAVYLGDIGSSLQVGTSPRIFGDWVFYLLYEEEEPDVLTMMGYQISTGETVELTEQLMEQYDIIVPLMMQDNTVYWYTYANGVFACDMDTRKIRQVIEWNLPREREEGEDYLYSIVADYEYIYCARHGIRGETPGKTELTIYSLEGEEIQHLIYEWEKQPLGYLLATPDYIIWGENNGFQIIPTHYLKRSDIAEGKAEFMEIGQ